MGEKYLYLPFVPRCRCVCLASCLYPAPSCLFLLSGYLFIYLSPTPKPAGRLEIRRIAFEKRGRKTPNLMLYAAGFNFGQFFLRFGYIWVCSLVRFGFEALKPSKPVAEPFGGQSREEMAIQPHSFASSMTRQVGTERDQQQSPPKPPPNYNSSLIQSSWIGAWRLHSPQIALIRKQPKLQSERLEKAVLGLLWGALGGSAGWGPHFPALLGCGGEEDPSQRRHFPSCPSHLQEPQICSW